ncbi:MAG: hypothetical protein KBT46_07395, partial [Ruminococcus sp.]|nr:hypothetical protein [Candidatus Copronaster equi]
MSNKNFKPATDKSSAVGKNNFKQRKDIDKYGMKIAAERDKKIKQQEKRSAEIKKQRQKQTEIETKQKQKADNKQQRQEKHQSNISAFKKFLNRVKYIFSFEFLMTVNFKRVFLFIVLPLVVIVSIIVIIANSVFANVPLSIRSFEYNGRIESENIAAESVYNNKQKEIFVDTLNSKGSKKVKFYIN